MNTNKQQYKRISAEERFELACLLREGVSKRGVALRLGRDAKAVRYELARCPAGEYCPIKAEKQAGQRRHEWKARKLRENDVLRERVIGLLQRGWTPERISGWLAAQDGEQRVSAKTIYNFVRSRRGQKLGLPKLLPRHWKKRRGLDGRSYRSHRIPNRRAISERSKAASDRLEPGHWEADTVQGRKGTGVILTLNERVTRYFEARLLPDQKSETVMGALKEVLSRYPTDAVKSVTFDNGTEFTRHEDLHSLGVETFFADPGAPHQRGANENSNGLLRRFIKKGADLRKLSHAELRGYIGLINEWPRKCLDYLSPEEEFGKLIDDG